MFFNKIVPPLMLSSVAQAYLEEAAWYVGSGLLDTPTVTHGLFPLGLLEGTEDKGTSFKDKAGVKEMDCCVWGGDYFEHVHLGLLEGTEDKGQVSKIKQELKNWVVASGEGIILSTSIWGSLKEPRTKDKFQR